MNVNTGPNVVCVYPAGAPGPVTLNNAGTVPIYLSVDNGPPASLMQGGYALNPGATYGWNADTPLYVVSAAASSLIIIETQGQTYDPGAQTAFALADAPSNVACNYFGTNSNPGIYTIPTGLKGLSLYNDSPTSNLYWLIGPGIASAANCSFKLVPGAYYEAPLLAGGLPFQGQQTATWDVVSTGGVHITEIY